MLASIIFGVFSLITCGLFCWFRTEKPSVYSLILKLVSSLCFVFCAIFAIKFSGSSNFNLLVLIGLIFGLIGDMLLDLKIMYPQDDEKYFVAGTSAFSIGHFFFFIASALFGVGTLSHNLLWNVLICTAIALCLTLSIILPSKKLGLNFGKMLYIVIFYSFILTFMMAFSISIAIFNPSYWIFACGMILFLLSDLVLSLQYFGGKTAKFYVYINHFLYYMAQVLLASSILLTI